jgi:hypothetical protein
MFLFSSIKLASTCLACSLSMAGSGGRALIRLLSTRQCSFSSATNSGKIPRLASSLSKLLFMLHDVVSIIELQPSQSEINALIDGLIQQ